MESEADCRVDELGELELDEGTKWATRGIGRPVCDDDGVHQESEDCQQGERRNWGSRRIDEQTFGREDCNEGDDDGDDQEGELGVVGREQMSKQTANSEVGDAGEQDSEESELDGEESERGFSQAIQQRRSQAPGEFCDNGRVSEGDFGEHWTRSKELEETPRAGDAVQVDHRTRTSGAEPLETLTLTLPGHVTLPPARVPVV